MIKTFLHAHNCPPEQLEENFAPLGEVLEETRRTWNEEPEGSQMFWYTDEKDTFLAMMFRHESDPEIAVTVYCDGTKEQHRCHYVLNEAGDYERTEVNQA